jgi:PAS domain S-box-containing protein
MLGMERKKIIGKTLGESLPKDQMAHFLEVDEMVLNSGQENLCEEPLTGHDGNILTIVTRKTCYVDEHGSRFVVGVIRDITERKRSEIEVKRNYDTQEVLNKLLQLSLENISTNELLERTMLKANQGFWC